MKNKIAGTVAAGIAALLIPAVSVQAVTVNFGTAATVSSASIQGWPKGPDTVSETAVLIDADTGAVLYDKGKDEYRYPASTTKIMTVLTAIENSSPEDSVTFTETGVRDVTWDSSNIGMQPGETITAAMFQTMQEAMKNHQQEPLSMDDVTAMIAGRVGQLLPMDEETAGQFQQLAKKMIELAGKETKIDGGNHDVTTKRSSM